MGAGSRIPALFCSEEGNQAAAKRTFGFTRAYNEKIGELRSSGRCVSIWIFEVKEEGNQAAAKRTFGFTRAYNEKIGELRSSGRCVSIWIFEVKEEGNQAAATEAGKYEA